MINGNPDAIRAVYRSFDDRLAATPGVEAVSQSWGGLPMEGEDDTLFWLDGQPKPATTSGMNGTIIYNVGPDYLRVMGIPLRRGRFFTAHDDEKAPYVGIVDDVFANKYFSGQDPIGKRIRLDGDERKLEIIGVSAT